MGLFNLQQFQKEYQAKCGSADPIPTQKYEQQHEVQKASNAIADILNPSLAFLKSKAFAGTKHHIKIADQDKDKISNTLKYLYSINCSEFVLDWFSDYIESILHELSKQFWIHFIEDNQNADDEESERLVVVMHLFVDLQYYVSVLEELTQFMYFASFQISKKDNYLVRKFRLRFQYILFIKDHSSQLKNVLKRFFLHRFRNFNTQNSSMELDSSQDSAQNANVSEIYSSLHKLGALQAAETVFKEILFSEIDSHIKSTCKSNFGENLLEAIFEWLNATVFGWLKQILVPTADIDSKLFDDWKTRLEFYSYETFARLRISEMFDIIVDFPDSMPALEDLKSCLTKTNQHKELISSLKKSLCDRLLHPGANTADIISQYISTIKALRIIDPSGLTLDIVSVPIRNYLQARDDTIRCIVSSCTEDTTSELYEELANSDETISPFDSGSGYAQANPNFIDADDAYDETQEELDSWQPTPIDALPQTGTTRKENVLNMLVNIYGSPELFVNEYRSMLSHRLLQILDYETEKELRILELLKLRFGETVLHNCEIMVKDMAESKRVNNICKQASKHPDRASDFSMDVTIASYLFWPTFKEENINLPPIVNEKLERYGKAFEKLKPSRQLQHKANLGSVELDLEFDNTTLHFANLTPLQATIIFHFQDKETWKLQDLATVINLPADVLKKRIAFWMNNGVIKEIEKNVFQLVEAPSQTSENMEADTMFEAEDEETSQGASQAQREELLKICGNFIIGMLKNFGSLTQEKIHNSLSTYVDSYDLTNQELAAFLAQLVKEDKLESVAGSFTLKK